MFGFKLFENIFTLSFNVKYDWLIVILGLSHELNMINLKRNSLPANLYLK